jgi:hypothetical protein
MLERHDPQVGVEGAAIRAQHRGFHVRGFAGQRATHHVHALAHVALGHAAREALADDVGARVAVDRLAGPVHVHDPQVLVPQEQPVERAFEDGAVLRLALAQVFQRQLLGLLGAQPLDFRRRADGEDLERGLHPVQVGERPPRGDRDNAQRRAVQRGERVARIALGAQFAQLAVFREEGRHARGVGAEALAEDGRAGSAGQGVRHILRHLAATVKGQHPHAARLRGLGPGDECHVDLQDGGQQPHQLVEHGAAAGGGDGQGHCPQRLPRAGALDLGGRACGDDAQHGRDEGRVLRLQGRALEGQDDADGIAVAVDQGQGRQRIHLFPGEHGVRWHVCLHTRRQEVEAAQGPGPPRNTAGRQQEAGVARAVAVDCERPHRTAPVFGVGGEDHQGEFERGCEGLGERREQVGSAGLGRLEGEPRQGAGLRG